MKKGENFHTLLFYVDETVIVGQTVCERQVTPGLNAPQGVEIVASTESNDQGNSIFVKYLETFVLSAV